MVEGNLALVLALSCLILCESFLPANSRAQVFSDTGDFYFTGSHNPLRTPIYREYITKYGLRGGEGLKAGPVRFHPFLGVAEIYTDNAFRRNTRRRSDFLTTIAPGLQALLPFGGGRHSFLLDYRAAQFLYNKFPENNVLAQEANGHVSLNFPSGLTLDLQGGHIAGFDPRGTELDIRARDITKWNINSIMGGVEYLGPTAGIRFQVRYFDLHFKNNGQAPIRDRTSARANLTFLANITSSTSALLGFFINDNDFDKNNQLDSFGYGIFTGFRLAPSRLLSGEFNIGYSVLNFDRAPQLQPAGSNLSSGGKQQEALFIQGNLNWRPTGRLAFRLSPFRSIAQAAVFGSFTFIQSGVNLVGTQSFTERLGLRGIFSFINADFDSGRNDNRIRVRIGPQYRIAKWLGFRLDYQFEKRFSNQKTFEYNSNTIGFSVEALL